MGVRNRILALVAVTLAIALGVILWGTGLTYKSQALEPAVAGLESKSTVVTEQNQPLDLDAAAAEAETFSEVVYSGLDTTKEKIGKTPARNQAIEQARDQASEQLEALAQRARQAEQGQGELSITDERILKHMF